MNIVTRCVARLAPPTANKTTLTRTFTTFTPLRPTVLPGVSFRPSTFTPTSTSAAPNAAVADLVPTSSVTSHPALQHMGIRFGPRNTMNGHTRLVQKRRSGFLTRRRDRTGRKILLRRRIKGRRELAQ
ncbi:large subunit ribosomal protein L34 [Geosmithia morbida]|uniref:Large subunit ribosomal protein L34 n=1 Tax=Geosmithia morbida TaxID=1094350 RepID=A0A9P4YPE8_9HYPO|nr:large subunit ribosomal protein L34 [Geosmithia morbida]KAF4120698.1 large subunit ribosomal protein L34 [Geosmithia morbida]